MGQGESQLCTHDPTSNKDVCLDSEDAGRLFGRSDIATNARRIAANTADIATLKSELERGTPSSTDAKGAGGGGTSATGERYMGGYPPGWWEVRGRSESDANLTSEGRFIDLEQKEYMRFVKDGKFKPAMAEEGCRTFADSVNGGTYEKLQADANKPPGCIYSSDNPLKIYFNPDEISFKRMKKHRCGFEDDDDKRWGCIVPESSMRALKVRDAKLCRQACGTSSGCATLDRKGFLSEFAGTSCDTSCKGDTCALKCTSSGNDMNNPRMKKDTVWCDGNAPPAAPAAAPAAEPPAAPPAPSEKESVSEFTFRAYAPRQANALTSIGRTTTLAVEHTTGDPNCTEKTGMTFRDCRRAASILGLTFKNDHFTKTEGYKLAFLNATECTDRGDKCRKINGRRYDVSGWREYNKSHGCVVVDSKTLLWNNGNLQMCTYGGTNGCICKK